MTEFTTSQDRRPIPGWEDRYEIDRNGNVYAMFAFKGQPAGRVIKSRVTPEGYVTTTLSRGGQGKVRTIHRLLMLTFNPIENAHLFEVNHIDGIKTNNRLDNLEWMTHHQNMLHARTIPGTWDCRRGERVGGCKLTAEHVKEIRRLYSSGVTQKDLAIQYEVAAANISHIIRRKTWAHIK